MRNYGKLQIWMFTHSNKRSVLDICQSLNQMIYNLRDNYDDHCVFNVSLVSAEAYQTVGHISQAHAYYDQAKMLGNTLNTSTANAINTIEKDQQRKKLDDIAMKLEFQSEFENRLIRSRNNQRFGEYWCFKKKI